MAVQLIDIIDFADGDSGDAAMFIVRAGDGEVALAMSLSRDGDMEVVFTIQECEKLRELLARAIAVASA